MSNNNTFNTTEPFSKIKELLRQLNDIHGTIFKQSFFGYEYDGENLLIHGFPRDLALLYALLWGNTTDYAFYMECDNGTIYIKVIIIPKA